MHNDNEALASNVAKVDVIKWLVKVLRLKEIYKLAQAKVNLFTIDSFFFNKMQVYKIIGSFTWEYQKKQIRERDRVYFVTSTL